MDVNSFNVVDPFAEETGIGVNDKDVGSQQNIIHIRTQQRNGKKSLTTLQGLPSDIDFRKLAGEFKREFACSATVLDDKESGKVIQLQGDHRTALFLRLTHKMNIPKDRIKVHGT